jgi:hypothetical protein
LAQLLVRARLLNDFFQRAILDVVASHAAPSSCERMADSRSAFGMPQSFRRGLGFLIPRGGLTSTAADHDITSLAAGPVSPPPSASAAASVVEAVARPPQYAGAGEQAKQWRSEQRTQVCLFDDGPSPVEVRTVALTA